MYIKKNNRSVNNLCVWLFYLTAILISVPLLDVEAQDYECESADPVVRMVWDAVEGEDLSLLSVALSMKPNSASLICTSLAYGSVGSGFARVHPLRQVADHWKDPSRAAAILLFEKHGGVELRDEIGNVRAALCSSAQSNELIASILRRQKITCVKNP